MHFMFYNIKWNVKYKFAGTHRHLNLQIYFLTSVIKINDVNFIFFLDTKIFNAFCCVCLCKAYKMKDQKGVVHVDNVVCVNTMCDYQQNCMTSRDSRLMFVTCLIKL